MTNPTIPVAGVHRIWTRAYTSTFVAYLLLSIGLQMCNVLVGKYTDSLGATPQLVGLVTSVFAITAMIFKCISAPMIDAFNRKYVLMGAVVALAIAFLGFGLSTSVPPLLGFRLLQGAGQAFTATTCIAVAATTLPREKLGTGLSIFSLAPAIAQITGPTISLKVSAAFGYNASFFIAAAIMVLSVVATTQIRLEFRKMKAFSISPRNIFAKQALLPAVLLMLFVGAYSLINSFLAIYAATRGVGSDIGYFFTVYGIVVFGSRPLAGRLTDRFGYLVVVPLIAIFIGAFFLISVSTNLVMFLVAAAVLACGYGAGQPLLQALAMKLVPDDRRGAGSCTAFLGSDLGNLAGPIVGGFLVSAVGYSGMYQGITVALVVAAILLVTLRRTIARQIAAAAAPPTQPATVGAPAGA